MPLPVQQGENSAPYQPSAITIITIYTKPIKDQTRGGESYCKLSTASVPGRISKKKISKIVINGSILVVRHEVEWLGKNKQF